MDIQRRACVNRQRAGHIAIVGSLLHRLLLGCFCCLGWRGRGLLPPTAAGGGQGEDESKDCSQGEGHWCWPDSFGEIQHW
ncbi:MAG: hypothetical protein F4074_01465 [Synechococcus sp. SB0672_bin_10]|nr:hypothetical protein [Synechococcus sp. SB0672_bin_10]